MVSAPAERPYKVPATYVIDTSSEIRFAHVEVDCMLGSAEPQYVFDAPKVISV